MLGEGVRVGATGHDVAEDPQPRDARDVAHDEGSLDVHLHQPVRTLSKRYDAWKQAGSHKTGPMPPSPYKGQNSRS